MNYKLLKKIILISLHICFSLHAKDAPRSQNINTDASTPSISNKAIIDPNESADVDFTFFNDPYLFDQEKMQQLIDLRATGAIDSGTQESSNVHEPIIDSNESRDVDFTFFNDPYAFEKFKNLPIKAKFGGYVQYSSWWDSRQVVAPAEGYILLFPEPKLFDVDCNDINARGDYNAGFLETRLRAEFYGPNVFGAETYAYVETDFIGSGVVANRLRIRHALMKLTWDPSELLLGQFWNPTFEPKCYPLTLDYGAGEPNAAFARNPQIRYRYAKGLKEFLLVAAAQLEQVNSGPIGASSTYLRNSRLPMLYARGAYDSENFFAGACISFERIIPRLESNKGYKVHESLNSAVVQLFAKIIFGTFEIRQNLIFSQNATNITLLGGYAVSAVNPATDERTYANLNTLTYWMDINIKRKTEPGLFIGIVKNLGARKDIIQCVTNPITNIEESTIYGLGLNMDTLFRIAPRVRYHALPADFCAELEFIRAGYGCINNKAQIKNKNPVTSVRLLFTTYYYF